MPRSSLFALCAFIALSAVLVGPAHAISTAAIDFGTEWLKVSIVKPGVPMEIALNNESQRKTAAVVGMRDGQLTFSDPALAVTISHPNKAFRYLLPLLGRKVTHPSVKQFQERFPYYEILPDESRGTVTFKVNDEVFTVEELVGLVLKHAAENAARFAEQPISQFVLTVPPFFNQSQRKALLKFVAAKLGGLKVSQLLNTNTAVAINYGIFRRASFNETEQNILFVDIGSQSTTATVVGYSTLKEKEKSTKLVPGLVVKGLGFDPMLGGLDWDFRIRDYLLKGFQAKKKTKGDITKNPRAMAKLFKEAQSVKKVLSANSETVSQIEGLFEDIDFSIDIKRVQLEEMTKDLFERISAPVLQALAAAEMRASELTQVIIIGGGVRIPKIQEILLKSLGIEELGKNLNGDEAAALGAAFQAAATTTGFKVQPFIIKDATPYPIEVVFDRPVDNSTEVHTVHRTLFHRSNSIPQKKSLTFNKFRDTFKFHVQYEAMSFLTDSQKEFLAEDNLSSAEVTNVAEAFEKHPNDITKGVKVHFAVDKSGIFQIEKSDVVFEVLPEESTLDSIREKISGLFSAFSGDSKPAGCEGDDCVASGDEEQEQNQEEGKDTSSTTGEESKSSETKTEEPEKPQEDSKPEEPKTEEPKAEEPKAEEPKTDDAADEQAKGQESQNEEANGQSESQGEKESTGSGDEGTTGESKPEGASNQNSTVDDASEAKNKTAPLPPAPPKPKMVRESLPLIPKSFTSVDLDNDTYEAANARLQLLLTREAERKANEAARNRLEAFVYGTKEKLETPDYIAVSTETEREALVSELNVANDWLYDEAFDATAKEFNERTDALNKTALPIFYRHFEYTNRAGGINYLLQGLNYTNYFLAKIHNISANDTWYTETEVTGLETLYNETYTWLMDKWALQNGTALTEEPVLTVNMIRTKASKLDRELMALVKKPKPKPKPTPKPPKAKKPVKEEEETEDTDGKSEGESDSEQSTQDDKPKDEGQSTFDDKPKKDSKKESKKEAPKKKAPPPKAKKDTPKKEKKAKEEKPESTEEQEQEQEAPKAEGEEPAQDKKPRSKRPKRAQQEEATPEEPLELDSKGAKADL